MDFLEESCLDGTVLYKHSTLYSSTIIFPNTVTTVPHSALSQKAHI